MSIPTYKARKRIGVLSLDFLFLSGVGAVVGYLDRTRLGGKAGQNVMLSESSTYQFDRYYFVISHPHLDGSEYPEILLGQVAQYLYVQLHP